MASITDPVISAILIAVLAAALIFFIVILIYKEKQKKARMWQRSPVGARTR
jgi:hypothetical protein